LLVGLWPTKITTHDLRIHVLAGRLPGIQRISQRNLWQQKFAGSSKPHPIPPQPGSGGVGVRKLITEEDFRGGNYSEITVSLLASATRAAASSNSCWGTTRPAAAGVSLFWARYMLQACNHRLPTFNLRPRIGGRQQDTLVFQRGENEPPR
jgi:hypothetical protein